MMRTEDRTWIVCAVIALGLVVQSTAWAQSSSRAAGRPAYTSTDDLTDVRPFDAWITDCVITEGVDIEPDVRWGNNDAFNVLNVDARLAVWAAPNLEVGGVFGLTSIDFDSNVLDDTTGASDLTLYGRYRFSGGPGSDDPTFAGGMLFDIPVGDEDVLEGTFDFALFGAFRSSLANGVDVFANASIESLEPRFVNDRENGIRLGGGAIVPITEEWAFIGEGNLGTADDSLTLTGGFDYELPPGGHLRLALTVGLDDGSDDIAFTAGFAIPVY
jgi:hypothetical protein